MKKLLTILIWIYAAACVLVLTLIPPGRGLMYGIARRPAGGSYSITLALPWSLAMRLLHNYHGVAYATVLVIFAMVMNIVLLVSLRRRLQS